MRRGRGGLSSTAQVKKLAKPAAAIATAAAKAIGCMRRGPLDRRAATRGDKLPGGMTSLGRLAISLSRDSGWRSFMIPPVQELRSAIGAHDAVEPCRFLRRRPAHWRLPHG